MDCNMLRLHLLRLILDNGLLYVLLFQGSRKLLTVDVHIRVHLSEVLFRKNVIKLWTENFWFPGN